MRKIRATTLLSLSGVLVAGSAAALVNTQVLGNPTPRPETMSEITAVLTLPPTTVSVAVPDTTLPAPTPPTSDTIATAPSVFDVEGVGTVTLDRSGEVLRLVSAASSPGWTITGTNQVDPSNVKVTLQSLDRTIEFTANLAGGEVSTSVAQSSNVTPSENPISTPISTPTSNSTSVSPSPSTPAGGSGPSRTDGSEGRTPSTPVTTGATTQSTSPSNAPTTSDDHGGGKGSGGGGKGGDDDIDD